MRPFIGDEQARPFRVRPNPIGALRLEWPDINLLDDMRLLHISIEHHDFVRAAHRHIGVWASHPLVGKGDLLRVRSHLNLSNLRLGGRINDINIILASIGPPDPSVWPQD